MAHCDTVGTATSTEQIVGGVVTGESESGMKVGGEDAAEMEVDAGVKLNRVGWAQEEILFRGTAKSLCPANEKTSPIHHHPHTQALCRIWLPCMWSLHTNLCKRK